MLEVIV